MATHFYTMNAAERENAVQNLVFADEGVTGHLPAAPTAGPAPLYRAYHPSTGGHFYTMGLDERDNATNNLGYVGEGVTGYLLAQPGGGATPLYRAYHGGSDDHFYTADAGEHTNAVQHLGYSDEGVTGYVWASPGPGTTPLYRLLKGTHFYTTSAQERQNAVQNLGFSDEGITGHVANAPAPGPAPLYRASHPASGGHFYTMSADERDNATSKLGYRAEGLAGYLHPQPAPGTVPLYRAYHGPSDDHFYTADAGEHTNAVQHLGYSDEGVTGHLYPAAVPGSGPLYRLFGPETATASFHFNLTAMAGWVQVDLAPNGTVTWSGHVHNDAFIAEAFEFSVRAVVGTSHSVLVQFSGSVGGTGASPAQRNCYWTQTETRAEVRANFEAIAGANSIHVFESRKGSITGVLQDIGAFLVNWIVGTVVVDTLGLVIFVGAEAIGLATGNGVATTQIIGGVLWLKGPSGSLFALTSAGAAQLGQRRRQISAAEYDWANAQVFGGTLPPATRIVLTDTIGGSGRQFSFPEAGGTISVNLGPAAFNDPVSTLPDVFLHELTHTWQIQHTLFDIAWMAQELADQIQGPSAYQVGPAGPPFAAFNYEAQAMIVQNWFNAHSRADDPYYRYIQENIRTGTP